MGYFYRLAQRVLLYASPHRQDNTYHSLCYTSRGAQYRSLEYIYIYIHIYVCMYVCMYVCVYVYIYIYIYRAPPVALNKDNILKNPGRSLNLTLPEYLHQLL